MPLKVRTEPSKFEVGDRCIIRIGGYASDPDLREFFLFANGEIAYIIEVSGEHAAVNINIRSGKWIGRIITNVPEDILIFLPGFSRE